MRWLPATVGPSFSPQFVNSSPLWGCANMNTKCVVGEPASLSAEPPGMEETGTGVKQGPQVARYMKLIRRHPKPLSAAAMRGRGARERE